MDIAALADWAQNHSATIPLLTIAASGVVALLTTLWTHRYRGKEVKISADHQITDGFARLVERLQAELENASEERRDMKEQISGLRRQVEILTGHIGNLESIMQQNGLKPPARAVWP